MENQNNIHARIKEKKIKKAHVKFFFKVSLP